MSDRYAALLADWRAASARTREAQASLTAKMEAQAAGTGRMPTFEDVQHVRQLRDIENAMLERAMAYMRDAALGAPSEPGTLR